VFVLALVTLAACGGGDDSGDDPAEVAARYLEALEDQDAEAACSELTERGRRHVVRETPGSADCTEAFDKDFADVGDNVPDFLRGEAKVRDPEISGDRAKVVVTSPNLRSTRQRFVVNMVSLDATWKVDATRTGVMPPR
jgi:hypothetical protein